MLADTAYARQERARRVGDAASNRAARLWARGMTADFDQSWQTLAPQVVTVTAAAQTAVAAGAGAYINRVASEQNVDGGDAAVNAEAFSRIDGSGRTLEGLLYGAVTAAKTAIGAGAGIQSALNVGGSYLATMVGTSVSDLGRSADLTAATGKKYVDYVRVVQSGACSRCAILAGIYSYKEAFKRHPRCRCTAMPVTKLDDSPARLFSSPDNYFQGLSASEQDRIFTKAGAEAIRAGADPVTVVSARRGAAGIEYSRGSKAALTAGRRLERVQIGVDKAGQPILGYVTGEGTSIRGAFGKQQILAGSGTRRVGTRYSTTKRVRLMPETIVSLTDDLELRRVLLRDAGYLSYPIPRTDFADNGWIARRTALIRADRAEADAFYRSHGISL